MVRVGHVAEDDAADEVAAEGTTRSGQVKNRRLGRPERTLKRPVIHEDVASRRGCVGL